MGRVGGSHVIAPTEQSLVVMSRPAKDGASRGPQSEPAESWSLTGLLGLGPSRGAGARSATHGCCRVRGADGAVRNCRGPGGLEKVRTGVG